MKTKKMVSLLLAIVMIVGMLPLAVMAAPSEDPASLNIVHVDCGRKYFSPASLKAIIDNSAAAGFNAVQLAFGNDGLRFLLNDMAVGSYTSEQVTNAIKQGNLTYNNEQCAGSYSTDVNELTQAEMDDIIAYAKSKGVEIIPLLNTPGHMNTIVTAMGKLGIRNVSYRGSQRTIRLDNKEAMDFTTELVQKYITYFAGKGCKYFNFGADEYANDIGNNRMGINDLIAEGKYPLFVKYVNDLAGRIETAGMTPMAFNDGFYYNKQNASFNTNIIVCYWSNGWGGYSVASPQTIASKGHKLVNTHGDWYWVLGKNDWQCSPQKASQFKINQFQGGTISNPAGAMFCIWADFPGAESEANVVKKTAPVIEAFGKTLPQPPKPPQPVEPAEQTVTDPKTNISVTGLDLTGITVTEANAPTIEGAEFVKAWDMKPTTANGNYTDSAVVSVPVPTDWVGKEIKSFVVNKDNSVTLLEGKVLNGVYTYVCPHFSVTGIYAVKAGAVTQNITLTVGGSSTLTLNNLPKPLTNADVAIAAGGDKVVEVTLGNATQNPVSGEVTHTLGAKFEGIANMKTNETKQVVIASGNNMLTGDRKNGTLPNAGENLTTNDIWTITCVNAATHEYTISRGNNYLVLTGAKSSKSLKLSATGDKNWVYANGHFEMSFEDKILGIFPKTYTYYLTQGNKSWTASETKSGIPLTFHEVVEHQPSTEPTYTQDITFKGLEVGETTVTINGVAYHVAVIAEDLSKVNPLKIEYWITNRPVTANNAVYLNLKAEKAYSEAGVVASTLVPMEGIQDNKTVTLWKLSCLPDSKHQTVDGGVDRTKDGKTIQKIRYWNSKWSYWDGTAWVHVKSNDQIVAYYLQVTDVTQEITTNVVDWGELYSGWKTAGSGHWFWGSYVENGRSFCYLDFAVVYPDGTQNPGNFPVPHTMFFHCEGGTRDIGAISFTENANYEIAKVTVTNGTATGYSKYSTFKPNYDAATERTVWERSEISVEPHLDGLTGIENTHGRLIKVYVKPKSDKGSLKVHYMAQESDGTTTQFHQMRFVTKHDTHVFNPNFGMYPNYTDINKALHDHEITNDLGVTQYVTADLSKLTTIDAVYRYSDYRLVKAERSAQGQDVYLYYEFKDAHKAFVIDFGLPLNLDVNTLGLSGTAGAKENTIVFTNVGKAAYGTVTISADKKGITYTPTSVLLNKDQFVLTFTEGGKQANVIVDIYPASNMLYEEGFMTQEANANAAWSGGNKGNGSQSAANNPAYGYDDAYKTSLSTAMNGSYTATVDVNGRTNKLTTTFTGTGFDLIGKSSPTTGTLFLTIKGGENTNKLVVIDTSHSQWTLNQVPLAHVVLPQGTYTAKVFGAYRKAPAAQTPAMVSAMAANSTSAGMDADLYNTIWQIMASEGIDDVEFVNIAETLRGMSTYAAPATPAGAPAVSQQAGTEFGIDGFRIYREGMDEANYADGEKNMKYDNVMNAVNGNLTAYVDGNAAGELNVVDYPKQGGPENEVYLNPGQSLALKGGIAQISFRAVSRVTTAKINGTTQLSIGHNTEMYYQVTTSADGLVTITNSGTELLAICNVKGVKADAVNVLVPVTEADYPAVFAMLNAPVEPAEPEAFQPESFNTSVSARKFFFNKFVTLKVTTSKDVAYLMVNGEKVMPDRRIGYSVEELWNSFWGKRPSTTQTFTFENRVGRNETARFEIIAYNADGVASEVFVVEK